MCMCVWQCDCVCMCECFCANLPTGVLQMNVIKSTITGNVAIGGMNENEHFLWCFFFRVGTLFLLFFSFDFQIFYYSIERILPNHPIQSSLRLLPCLCVCVFVPVKLICFSSNEDLSISVTLTTDRVLHGSPFWILSTTLYIFHCLAFVFKTGFMFCHLFT